MPRDKTAAHTRIINSMREEFLTWGYEKASVNRIAKKAGITPAGLYRHFKGKEDMFGSLVSDTLKDLRRMETDSEAQMRSDIEGYSPFEEEYMIPLVDFIYDHYEGIKLLVCCSAGSVYGSFEEDQIEIETESNKQYAYMLRRAGFEVKPLTDMQWHLLSTEYIHLVFEMVRHDMTREEAYEHMEFIKTLLYPGWSAIFGL